VTHVIISDKLNYIFRLYKSGLPEAIKHNYAPSSDSNTDVVKVYICLKTCFLASAKLKAEKYG